ncbi:FkbM family methyltransferase [Candidatus Micrarchaeota archaeon]|nr:FkbM family methyltransferase [Candidatus Micrarchaeota archaeon]
MSKHDNVLTLTKILIKSRLHHIKNLFSGKKSPVEIKTDYGNYLIEPKTSMYWIVEEIVKKKIYDVKKTPNEKDVILDLGMNIGIYSVYASKRFGSKIIGVEPVRDNFNIAVKNIKHNKLDEFIITLNKAVSNKDGEKLKLWIDDKNVGGHSTIKDLGRKRKRYEEVETVSLLTLIKEYNPNVIKCDIEGAEWEIFTENNFDLMKNVYLVMMEVHQFENHNIEDMKKLFEKNNYKTSLVKDDWDQKSAMLYAIKE